MTSTPTTDPRRAVTLARRLGMFLDAQYAAGYTHQQVVGALRTALEIERAIESASKSAREPVDNSTVEC